MNYQKIQNSKQKAFLNQLKKFLADKFEPAFQYQLADAEKLFKDDGDGDANMKDAKIDQKLIKQLKKYIDEKQAHVDKLESYEQLKADFEKSKVVDLIDFKIIYDIKQKELKSIKMRELATKRVETIKKKDEEARQKMSSEDYTIMKKKQKIKRKNRFKTD